jgi:hypothetical protein
MLQSYPWLRWHVPPYGRSNMSAISEMIRHRHSLKIFETLLHAFLCSTWGRTTWTLTIFNRISPGLTIKTLNTCILPLTLPSKVALIISLVSDRLPESEAQLTEIALFLWLSHWKLRIDLNTYRNQHSLGINAADFCRENEYTNGRDFVIPVIVGPSGMYRDNGCAFKS